LGAQDNLVGVTVYCSAKDKEKVGTLLEPSIEKIYSLSPDLVISTQEGNNPRAIEKLQGLKIKTIILGPDHNFSDISADFLKLAFLVDKKEKAEEILSDVKSKIDTIRKKLENKKRIRVFLQMGDRPLITIGEQSFLNEIIEVSGGENIFHEANLGYLRVNKEEVIKRNPQMIIIVPMEGGSQEEITTWSGFKAVDAVKENNIFVLEKDSFLKPTPVAYLEGVEAFSRIIHPEVFK
jgi:iron complex transport system substrate-binding protein